ncbi:MAG: ROK family protein, partial [Gemmatimonadetes bacterium]|nr:ROK family protein [Gemmatimonadota bacterium]
VRDGAILAEARCKTPTGKRSDAVPERIADLVDELRRELGENAPLGGVCVGAPGAVDSDTGIVHHAPNLGWFDYPLAEVLSALAKLPVVVENDVTIGAIGEHEWGAGRGTRDMVALFVGTGVGGALIVNGAPLRGFRGAAGEIGHLVAVPGGRVCPCGRRGCFEAYTSRTAMRAILEERMAEGRRSAVRKIMKKKGKTRMSSSVIEAALDRGDPLMTEVLAEAQSHLATLVANVVNTIDPEMVVFGGGLVARLGARFVDPIAREARAGFMSQEGAERIRIVPAELGDHAGTIGAAVVAGERFGD